MSLQSSADRMNDKVFARAGIAATFTPAGGAGVPCQIIVEHDLAHYGENVDLTGARAVIAARRSAIGDSLPEQGDSFTLTDTGAVWKVVDTVAFDGDVYDVAVR
jgi:hypothetical protein